MSVTNVACSSCMAKNRIPNDRLADQPKCGKCKKPLFSGLTFELTDGNAGAYLSRNDIPVLIDCWAPWCGPCQSFGPVFAAAAKKFEPAVLFAKLDTEANQQMGARWKIRSIPTLILFKNGEEAARINGALPMAQLQQWLEQQGCL